MTRARFSAWLRAGVLALSVLLLPLSGPTFAQVRDTTPTPDTRVADGNNYNRGYTGLWGLAGLLGLAGLAGRGRRGYPERPHTETPKRPVV
jgi:hypothetical protein